MADTVAPKPIGDNALERKLNRLGLRNQAISGPILGLPPLNQYDAAATDLRDMFTVSPDFAPFSAQPVTYVQTANPIWLALSKDIDFSQPDVDEVKLVMAIMKSEGLPRHARFRFGTPSLKGAL